MRDKILQALRDAGHGLTPNKLLDALGSTTMNRSIVLSMLDEFCILMESDKLLILHPADGSANTVKGEIVLITLRPEGH